MPGRWASTEHGPEALNTAWMYRAGLNPRLRSTFRISTRAYSSANRIDRWKGRAGRRGAARGYQPRRRCACAMGQRQVTDPAGERLGGRVIETGLIGSEFDLAERLTAREKPGDPQSGQTVTDDRFKVAGILKLARSRRRSGPGPTPSV